MHRTMDNTPQIVIRKSRKKAIVTTLAGFLIGIAGGLVLMYGNNPFVGWSGIIIAVLTLLLGISSLYDHKPYIVLTEEGITETTTIRELIEWPAIRYADDFYFRGQYIVRLILDRTYKPQLIRPTWFWRFDRIYGREGVKAVYIRTSGLEINSMQLVALIERMVGSSPAERAELLRQGIVRRKRERERDRRAGAKKNR